MKKKILGLMMAVAVVCTSSNYVMAAQEVGNINFHLNPHGNADETGSVTKTTAKSYANIYIQNASGFATNNRVIARVHKASDRSTATEYKYISQGVDFTLWRLAGKTYSSGVNYYLKMKTEDAANNSVDISGYWRP